MYSRAFSRNISENMHARCVREDTKQALKENLQADGVQSRQTLFVRYCPKYTASEQPRTTKQAKHLYDASPVCYGTRRCRLLHNLYQLDDCHLCCVAAARSNLHDLGVAALAVSILRCDFVKELLCNALLGYISHNLTL